MDKAAALAELYAEYAKRPLLQELAQGRRLVPGKGPLNAPLVVVGEAPGQQEEASGEPFVGPAGQLLQSLFDQAHLPWHLCYRTNTVLWRPPGNRTPYPFQVQESQDRVEREIGIISPMVVIAAGSPAWRAVSRGDLGDFATARGTIFRMPGKNWVVLPVWHPSALLRAGHDTPDRKQMEGETLQALQGLRKDGNG